MENDKGILQFDLSAKQIKYRDILNKEFIELEIYAISDINPNRNKSHFTLESMEKALPNVKNKPIVGFFENGDFTTHEGKADYDFETQKEFWNTEKGERILGWVRESDPVEIVEEKGLHWLKFRCVLCTTYCYKQVLRLLKDKKKKVSVEITVHNSETVNNIEQIYDFSLNGVTILGSKNGKAVLEGIPGAHLSVLERMDEENFEKQKEMLTFAYQQLESADSADDANIVNDETRLNEENTKKEVNQANMDNEKMFTAAIKVDKSKEAMSEKPWGEVDKTELRRRVVEAENFKSIAGDIFLDLREGWEDGEVSKLKYPVMELKGDTAVYNRGALASAKAYAEQHGEEEVLSKLKKIYEHLELDEAEDDKEAAYAVCEECKTDYCDECGCEEGEKAEECGHYEGEKHGPECDCPECMAKHAEEGVVVTELMPDVTIIEEPKEEVNEEEDVLKMKDEGKPEEVIVDARMPEGVVPEEGLGVIVANEEDVTKIQIVDDENKKPEGAKEITEDHSKWIEQLDALTAKYEELEKAFVEKEEELKACQAKLDKCCDYEDIKHRMCEAEAKLEKYRCGELKAAACKLMECEQIKDEFYKDIMDKCCDGTYKCEDDIKKDVAFAIYNSRTVKEKRFSTAIPSIEIGSSESKTRKREITAAEGIQNYLNKK